VRSVRQGFFPLDERLQLGHHSWTPESIKEAVGLGVEIPSYRRAAERFEGLTKLGLSKSSLQRLTDEAGQVVVGQQAVEAEATVKAPEKDEVVTSRDIPEPDSEVMAVSMDGVLINIRGEGWKEVKVATISAVEVAVQMAGDEEQAVHLGLHSYRAGLWEAKEFAKQQWAEACRRGLEKAKTIVSVNDGAVWIWLIVAMCYAPCVEIIDWWHLVEKLWAAANALFGQGQAQTTVWVQQQKSHLWTGQRRAVLQAIRQVCPRTEPLPEPVRPLLSYLLHHRRRMDYERFRQAGYPVGSGSTESACKVVVQERMKQAGMRWGRETAQAMLALRSVLLSGRWDEVWSAWLLPPKPA
jgi:hypothetical protein